ncbi:hypothetical protein OIU77_029052 [Salix suchowensis]|uniref:Uncharacterized protein n=1 Tax=Salix suchowensis TaxID=1278906 RepID=A0ABQ9BJJ7_9ROSI|nr:hypothetical protein OIU77_029052 [Salix suchowensis]
MRNVCPLRKPWMQLSLYKRKRKELLNFFLVHEIQKYFPFAVLLFTFHFA